MLSSYWTNDPAPITVFYSPNDVSVFNRSHPSFESLRMELGGMGAIKKLLKGGVYNSTEDTPWLAMSYAIRVLGFKPDNAFLYCHSNSEWHRHRFDEEGDLIDPFPSRDDLRFRLLCMDDPIDEIV